MTQEQKDLLLKDLCERLPYGVKCTVYSDTDIHKLSGVVYEGNPCELYFKELDWKECDGYVRVEYCKPYLFPLSSMTEEQKKESPFESSLLNAFINGSISLFEDEELTADDIVGMLDWLNENHFDYRNLIDKNLAIDATGLNIY